MRSRRFCCCSFILVALVVTVFNVYLLHILNPMKIPTRENEVKPVPFTKLESDASEQYKIFHLFTKRKRHKITSKNDDADVTIVTQTSVSNLHDLGGLASSWDGLISVAVFAPGEDIAMAVESIITMRECSKQIKERITFTLVFALSHPPKHQDVAFYIKQASSHPRICGSIITYREVGKAIKTKNYDNHRVPYPVNLLRNVALSNAKTTHVLVIDIDMLTSQNLRKDFRRNFQSIRKPNAVYVLPTFEVQKASAIPQSKNELLKLWKQEKARPFYEKVCWKCQKYTDYAQWRRFRHKDIAIAYKVDWHDPWEPFFIAERKNVHYDERFKQYGFNRISQVCETHVAGFDFHVLNNAFLVHRGFKNKVGFHRSKDEENSRNKDLYRIFKQEIKQKYTSSVRHC